MCLRLALSLSLSLSRTLSVLAIPNCLSSARVHSLLSLAPLRSRITPMSPCVLVSPHPTFFLSHSHSFHQSFLLRSNEQREVLFRYSSYLFFLCMSFCISFSIDRSITKKQYSVFNSQVISCGSRYSKVTARRREKGQCKQGNQRREKGYRTGEKAKVKRKSKGREKGKKVEKEEGEHERDPGRRRREKHETTHGSSKNSTWTFSFCPFHHRFLLSLSLHLEERYRFVYANQFLLPVQLKRERRIHCRRSYC